MISSTIIHDDLEKTNMGRTLQQVKVSTVSELPKNLVKTVNIGSIEIALFHLENEKFRAI
jgi:nitrite reductase (NADH) small subunit